MKILDFDKDVFFNQLGNLLKNSHIVIKDYDFMRDDLLNKLISLGVPEALLRKAYNTMEASERYTEDGDYIGECLSLYPAYNLTFMYPFFGLYGEEYYLRDILEAHKLIGAKDLYVYCENNFYGLGSQELVEKIFKDMDINIYVVR